MQINALTIKIRIVRGLIDIVVVLPMSTMLVFAGAILSYASMRLGCQVPGL